LITNCKDWIPTFVGMTKNHFSRLLQEAPSIYFAMLSLCHFQCTQFAWKSRDEKKDSTRERHGEGGGGLSLIEFGKGVEEELYGYTTISLAIARGFGSPSLTRERPAALA